MAEESHRLDPGLYLVATPIGNSQDITLRALDILARADVLAAEDTRNTRKLMEIHGIKLSNRQILPYHDHNGPAQRPRVVQAIREGKSVAFVSDAGTPLVADPGYQLARAVTSEGLPLTAAPGPSAMLVALSLSGLPSDRFCFAGFPPSKSGPRLRNLREMAATPATLVYFESPKRLRECLLAMLDAFGDREAAVCRELTKKFEEVRRGKLSELAESYLLPPKGEVVVVVAPPVAEVPDAELVDRSITEALKRGSVKDAAAEVSEMMNLPRKQVYARALELKDKKG